MAQAIFTDKETDGIGTIITTSGTMAAYAFTLTGLLDGAFCTILADINGGTAYVPMGSLTDSKRASVVMLPAGTKVTCKLDGARAETNITVVMGG